MTSEPFVVTRSWALLIAVGVIAILAFIFDRLLRPYQTEQVSKRRQGLKALVIGSDNRASTSKVQASLWTVAVLFALTFLLVLGRSTACGEAAYRDHPTCTAVAEQGFSFNEIIAEPLQPEYFVLLGFPLAAALSAKALTTAKVAGRSLDKQKAPDREGAAKGLSEVVTSDAGDVDLVDFQYFAFNLLALGFFFVEFLTDPFQGLPTLPGTLIGLAGLSAATYTTKKALQSDDKPKIESVVPHRIPLKADQSILIRGSGFKRTGNGGEAGSQQPPKVTLDGVTLPLDTSHWSPTLIKVTLDQAAVGRIPVKPDHAPVQAELQVDLGPDMAPLDPLEVEVYEPVAAAGGSRAKRAKPTASTSGE